jgi:hypothetical protein
MSEIQRMARRARGAKLYATSQKVTCLIPDYVTGF